MFNKNKKRIEDLEKRLERLEVETGNENSYWGLSWFAGNKKYIPNNETLNIRLEKVEQLTKAADYEYQEETKLVKKPKED